MNKYW